MSLALYQQAILGLLATELASNIQLLTSRLHTRLRCISNSGISTQNSCHLPLLSESFFSKLVLPLKPGVGQYIAIHATLSAKDFFLATFYSSHPFTCILSKTSGVFPVLALANTVSCLGPQNKIGRCAGCRSPC